MMVDFTDLESCYFSALENGIDGEKYNKLMVMIGCSMAQRVLAILSMCMCLKFAAIYTN